MSTASGQAGNGFTQEYVEIVRWIYDTNYMIVAACTVLCHDVFSNLEDEITYIWRDKWSVVKTIYLFVRYCGIIFLFAMFAITTTVTKVSNEMCRDYFTWVNIGGPLIFATVSNVILVFRIYALYDKNQKVLLFLSSLLGAQLVAGFYMFAQFDRLALSSGSQIPSLIGYPWPECVALEATFDLPHVIGAQLVILIIAIIFFFLTLANLIGRLRPDRLQFRQVSPFFDAFVRDSTWFYFSHMVTLIIALILRTVIKNLLSLSAIILIILTYSYTTSRLVLNPRVLAARQRSSTLTWNETAATPVPDARINERYDLPIELRLLQ